MNLGLFFNPDAEQKPRPYFYWHVGYLQAVSYGDWKLNLQGEFTKAERTNIAKATYGLNGTQNKIQLFNLNEDPSEKINVADKHPDIVSKLKEMAEKERKALGEWTNKGEEVRKTILVENP